MTSDKSSQSAVLNKLETHTSKLFHKPHFSIFVVCKMKRNQETIIIIHTLYIHSHYNSWCNINVFVSRPIKMNNFKIVRSVLFLF